MNLLDDRLGVIATPADIQKSFRIGQSKNEAKPRPLLVTLGSIEMRDDIFRNAYKLRGDRTISFSYDLTLLERDEYKRLIEDAKTKTKNDKEGAFYKVKGPPWDRKIVRITRKETVVPIASQASTATEAPILNITRESP